MRRIHVREKQSDTFAEQRRHFISTAMAARLVRSQLRGRLIDGVPFHSSPLCEVVLFLPQFLYFFRRAPDRQSDRLTDARILLPLLSTVVPFIFAGLAASQTIRMNSCLYTIHLSCQQSRKMFSLFPIGINLYPCLVGVNVVRRVTFSRIRVALILY